MINELSRMSGEDLIRAIDKLNKTFWNGMGLRNMYSLTQGKPLNNETVNIEFNSHEGVENIFCRCKHDWMITGFASMMCINMISLCIGNVMTFDECLDKMYSEGELVRDSITLELLQEELDYLKDCDVKIPWKVSIIEHR